MAGAIAFLYGTAAYIIALLTSAYLVGFVGNIAVPKSIDYGIEEPAGGALPINLFLLGLFALQHSVMARRGFKNWWIRIVPPPIERSTYILSASLLLLLLFWKWRPMPAVVWHIETPEGHLILESLFWVGWLLALASTFMIDHFDFLGLRPVYFHLRGKVYAPPKFKLRGLYRCVRHPLMLGLLIAFWATPKMSAGHLLFAAVMTAYIFIGIFLEERDLLGSFGEAYQEYRRRIPMIFPFPKRK